MLHPKIVEVTTDQKTGETYVLVEFWGTKAARTRDDPPFLIEDFIIPLRPTGLRPIDPDNPALGMEVYDRDLVAEIEDHIRRYIVRAEEHGYVGDNTSANATTAGPFSVGGVVVREKGKLLREPRLRDESDPHGILAKPEVVALRGKDIDLAAVGP